MANQTITERPEQFPVPMFETIATTEIIEKLLELEKQLNRIEEKLESPLIK